jgi:hypothetical protein
MRICVGLVLLSVSPTAALAQSEGWYTANVIYEGNEHCVSPEFPCAQVEIYFHFTGLALFGATEFTLTASYGGVADGLFTWMNFGVLDPLISTFDGLKTPPVPPASNPSDIVTGQLNFPPANIFGNASNPIHILTVEWCTEDFTPRNVDLTSLTQRAKGYTSADDMANVDFDSITELSDLICVVPTPASAVVLAGAALLASARRRPPSAGR